MPRPPRRPWIPCLLMLLALGGCSRKTPPSKTPPPTAKSAAALKNAAASLSSLQPLATLQLGGHPDWMTVAAGSVWISNGKLRRIQRISVADNKIAASIPLPAPPCSGLTFAFNSLWVPLCGKPTMLARISPHTNRITKLLPIRVADSEGGIAASGDSIWLAADAQGTLQRIDPRRNRVRQRVRIAPGSFNPLYSAGVIWVTGYGSNRLIALNAATGRLLAAIPVGPHPRFITAGAGAIWTLNQGDGSISRVDTATRRLSATIPAGIPGGGGEIHFGGPGVWATVFRTPLTLVSTQTDQILRQWKGPGGDSVGFGAGSVWLTDYRRGLLWRFDPARLWPR